MYTASALQEVLTTLPLSSSLARGQSTRVFTLPFLLFMHARSLICIYILQLQRKVSRVAFIVDDALSREKQQSHSLVKRESRPFNGQRE